MLLSCFYFGCVASDSFTKGAGVNMWFFCFRMLLKRERHNHRFLPFAIH